jgi:DNA-binding GntR family transcriptional regulator
MPRKGYRIRQPDPGRAREIYEVRLALELFVIEHVTSRRVPDPRLDALSQQWVDSNQCAERDGEEFADLDRQFHETFAAILGNATLAEQLQSIDERLQVFRIIEFQNEATRRQTCRQHMDILAAVGSGDVEAARDAVRTNIETAIQNVQEVIKEALARSYMKTGQGETWGKEASG